MISHLIQKIRAMSHSIRWRLPLTYAGIALLTAVALNGLLLFTLRSYYYQREREYLQTYAPPLAGQAEQMFRDGLTDQEIQSATNLLSFLAQARVQLLDTEMNVVADSGPVSEQQTVNMDFVRTDTTGQLPGVAVAGGASTGSTIAYSGPYLSVQAEQGPIIEGPPDQQQSRPMEIRRGPFGQRLTDETDHGKRSKQQAIIAFYNRDGTIKGYLKLSEGPAFGSTIVNDVAEKGIIAALVAVLIAAVAGGFISQGINQPVLALAEATQQMAQGDLATRVDLNNRQDEFGLLAVTFNGMAERVETTVKTLKQFVEDAAHEINTPLTALRTNLELTSGSGADIHQALTELTRLEKLTRSLLTLARLEAPGTTVNRTPVDLTTLARQMIERYASCAEQAEITLQTEIPQESIVIDVDQTRITRMLDNLLDNALKFTPPNGQVLLGMQVEKEDQVSLWVQDTGIGIPEAELPKLFSRFHRGRNAAAYPGNGLGLVIVKSIVEEHGGQITVTSGSGITRFTVNLPCHRKGQQV